MDSSTSGTPSWLAALIAIAALGAAVVFGLYMFRHTERAALEAQNYRLAASLSPLRIEEQAVKDRIKPLEEQIADRRARLDAIKESDSTAKGDVDRLVAANLALLKTNQDLLRKEQSNYANVTREAPERRKELSREEERAFASERDNDERRRQLREDVEKQSQATEQQRKKWNADVARQDTRIRELEGRVQQLTQQLDLSNQEFRPDGQILASEAKDGFVVIDRGQHHHLRRDTRFTVYNRRAGKVVTKGQIQVVTVNERFATCRVLAENDANDPLVAGDLLHNPVYDPDRTRGFTVRGEFSRFSRTEISRFVEDSGGRIDQGLSVDTDYLVAGAGAQKDLEQAVKLGVSIISEDQLIEFLRGGALDNRK